ncbi:MAG: hypothetical protein K6A31_11115 [Fibrobacter sp.]|nr:hypothetical protein [Fibrobacter sp.]
MLGIQQKKGDPEKLCGRLVVYAKITPSASKDQNAGPIPFASMVRNGILAVRGEFEKNNSIKRFLQHEAGASSVDKGISDMIEHIKESGGELPEGLDIDSFKDRLEELSSMEIIPVPAKIMFYDNEEEILEENADIYYIGEFSGMSQAHLCITSLPILYQAKYREQQNAEEQSYINELLSQIETDGLITSKPETGEFLPGNGNLLTFVGNLQELLERQVVPYLLYQAADEEQFSTSLDRFYAFMAPYKDQRDVQLIGKTLRRLRVNENDVKERSRLELLCRKVSAMYHEKFEQVPEIQKKLSELDL